MCILKKYYMYMYMKCTLPSETLKFVKVYIVIFSIYFCFVIVWAWKPPRERLWADSMHVPCSILSVEGQIHVTMILLPLPRGKYYPHIHQYNKCVNCLPYENLLKKRRRNYFLISMISVFSKISIE